GRLHRNGHWATHDIPVSFHHTFGVLVPGEFFFLKMNDSAAYADRHGLRASALPQVFHDVLDLDLRSFFRDEEPLGDIPISISTRDMTEDFHLAFGQDFIAHMFSELCHQLRGNALLPRVNLADDLNQLLGRHALEHVSPRLRLQGAFNVNVAFECSQYDDARVVEFGSNRDHRFDTASVGKSQVHERNVGLVLAKLLHGVLSVGRLCHHQHV